MKNFSIKTICLVALVASVSVDTFAQSVNSGINTRDARECRQYLTNHPTDTLKEVFKASENGVRQEITRRVFLRGGKLTARQDTVVFTPNPEVAQQAQLVKKVDSLSIETRVEHSLHNDRPQDVIYAESIDAKQYRNGVNGDESDNHAGKVVLKRADKYGWSVQAHAGYAFGSDANGVIGGLGLGYDRRWWGIDLYGEIGKSKFSHNAVRAGETYMVYRTESILKIRPFELDEYDQNRLFIFGGVCWENTDTDSKMKEHEDGHHSELSSRGNYLYGTCGVAFEHRIFATGNCLGARLQWRNSQAIVQNSSKENFGTFALSLYYKFGFYRNRVNNGY